MTSPNLYILSTRLGRMFQGLFVREGKIADKPTTRMFPPLAAWTAARDLRPIDSTSFRDRWRDELKGDGTTNTSNARENILASIREHLAASREHDRRVLAQHVAPTSVQSNGSTVAALSNIELFKTNLEAVNGHCIIARTELEIVHALTRIINELKHTQLNPRRIALSDAKGLERLVRLVAVQLERLRSRLRHQIYLIRRWHHHGANCDRRNGNIGPRLVSRTTPIDFARAAGSHRDR